MSAPPLSKEAPGLFRTGDNCWRIAEAGRLAVLVDGEEYFETFVRAAQRARRSIMVLAWDFDSRVPLHCLQGRSSRLARLHGRIRHLRRGGREAPPQSLGEFLNELTRRNRELQIRILIWDYPMIFGLDREFPPLYGLGWKPRRRVHVNYDNSHPVGASHHQKLVVIDDELAFCGGIDLTSRRWDTCRHWPHEQRRVAGKAPYPPFHDMMMLVDGECARTLGELARERWARATGQHLPSEGRRRGRSAWRLRGEMSSSADVWPARAQPLMTNVPVAIVRTMPAREGAGPVREIERLYLDMIASAKRCIYIENQYFTSHSVGEALARRLSEPDGPQVVLVLRLLSHGWLEAMSMEVLRARLLRQLQAADRHGRLRFFFPQIGGLDPKSCIDVHAKLMIVDDDMLRIGSANLSNRSMCFDSECDLAVAADGRPEIAAAIAGLRNRLLGEHLGVEPQVVADTHAQLASLVATIDSLKKDPAALQLNERTLQPFAELPEVPEPVAEIIEIADPEQPVSLGGLAPLFASTDSSLPQRPAWGRLITIVAVLLALGAMWRWTPLSEFATPARVHEWAERFADAPWAPFAVVLAYTPACVVMFPRPLISLFAIVAFGPLIGFLLAMSGNLFAAWMSFLAGKRISLETLRRLAGPNFSRISSVLRQRGVLAVTAVRLVPLAPYAIPGLIAGAARVGAWAFMIGTFLGLLPGGLVTVVFGAALHEALEEPGTVNFWLAGAIALAIVLATWWVRRWLLTTRVHDEETHSREPGLRSQ